MKTTVVDHPLAAEQLTVLRDETTDRATFRRAVDNLAAMLIYEATRDLAVETTQVRTPLGPGGRGAPAPPSRRWCPVLRAGLGMADAAIRLLPEAEMSFVGLARDEETFEPHSYMAKLPARLDGRPVIILDPMLATGGSLEFTCRLDRRARRRPHDRRVRARRTRGTEADGGDRASTSTSSPRRSTTT